jgi:uncharacterized protein (DUF488 family)
MGAAECVIYSIGHSNHRFERWLELLTEHGIDAVADVRTTPSSRFAPWSARAALARQLPLRGIHYVFLGEQLGGRPQGDAFASIEDRDELYRRIAEQRFFQDGIDRLLAGAARYRVAMLCSEEDPSACHRHNLVAPALRRQGVAVWHIRRDGSLQAAEDVAPTRARAARSRVESNRAAQLALPADGRSSRD